MGNMRVAIQLNNFFNVIFILFYFNEKILLSSANLVTVFEKMKFFFHHIRLRYTSLENIKINVQRKGEL